MIENNIWVLVVEDNPSWQNILSEILLDMDFLVDVAETLEQAETFIRGKAHRLAFIDLSLDKVDHKNTDGFRVLKMIRDYDPGCTPLLLSGYVDVEAAVRAIKELGAYTCFQKENFSRSEFKQTISDMLASSAPVDSSPVQDNTDGQVHQGDASTTGTTGLALVVDDDAGWRDLLSELLRDGGFNVEVSASFGEAIGYLSRSTYDLAVIDLSLNRQMASSTQEYEGFRLLEKCQADEIPTIVVSGVGSTQEIEQVYERFSIFTFIEKQAFERGTFLRALQEIQEQHTIGKELDVLTERELEVLKLLAQGMINKEIASQLVVSPNTIKRHVKSIFEKLAVHNRSAATAVAIQAGLLKK